MGVYDALTRICDYNESTSPFMLNEYTCKPERLVV